MYVCKCVCVYIGYANVAIVLVVESMHVCTCVCLVCVHWLVCVYLDVVIVSVVKPKSH